MTHHEHKQLSPKAVSCAVLTFSDTRSEADDGSGKILIDGLKSKGHTVTAYAVLKDDSVVIRKKLDELLLRDDIDVIITNGSTGVSHRDVAVETVTPLLDKTLDGFGELFRRLSYDEIGTAAMLSRAIAGVANGKVIICIPGSPGAARTAIEKIILPEIGHMVREVTR